MIYNNYFQKSFKKVMKRFLFGSFLLILIVILYIFNGTADNIWGLITLISAAPGVFYFMWGIVKIPAMLRAKTILKEEFPPDIDKSDIVLHAELSLPDIGTFIYKKHLFVLNKFWYYCVDLTDVSWLFVITLSSNVSSEDCLVVNTYY